MFIFRMPAALLVLLLVIVGIGILLLQPDTGDGMAGTMLEKAGSTARWIARGSEAGLAA